MTVLLALVAAGVVSWLLRVLFIAVVPAARLPEGFRRAVAHAGPAALAALIAAGLVRPGPGITPLPVLLALFAGGVVAWRTRHLLASTATAIAVFTLLTL
jgi:branched-subunit amino acid transport protein